MGPHPSHLPGDSWHLALVFFWCVWKTQDRSWGVSSRRWQPPCKSRRSWGLSKDECFPLIIQTSPLRENLRETADLLQLLPRGSAYVDDDVHSLIYEKLNQMKNASPDDVDADRNSKLCFKKYNRDFKFDKCARGERRRPPLNETRKPFSQRGTLNERALNLYKH